MTGPSSPTDPRFLPLDFSGIRFKARRSTTRLVIHSLDTDPDWTFDIREIDRWHREERGWAAIGYHYVIARDGTVVQGRPLDVIGAHTVGWNETSVAIALAGGKGSKPDDPFDLNYTDQQFSMLYQMIEALKRLWPAIGVVGHHDHPKVTKACPGFRVARLVSLMENTHGER